MWKMYLLFSVYDQKKEIFIRIRTTAVDFLFLFFCSFSLVVFFSLFLLFHLGFRFVRQVQNFESGLCHKNEAYAKQHSGRGSQQS